MNFNEQQTALFDWAAQGTGSCNLIARAGTGKTTTIIELAKRISGSVFLGAFNKAIAEELKTRIQRPNVEAGTMHSLGFKLWRGIANGRTEIDAKKVFGIIKKFDLFTFDKTPRLILASAVGFAKQGGFGLPNGPSHMTHDAWTNLFDYHDFWDELPGSVSPERMLNACVKVYAESLSMCQEKDPLLDFDDMILAPLMFGAPKGMYDWVMIDEAQDTNMVRRILAQWVLKPEGRMVAVGDPRQAIYGFAGANHDSMDQIKAAMGSIELPLSITYRCPKLIVAKAQTLVPDIQAHDSAPEGIDREIDHSALWKEDFSDTDVILCRNTRPLIGVAKRLRKMGIPCSVEGANAKALIALASKWGEDIQIGQMEEKLAAYVSSQVTKWEGKNRLDKADGIKERQQCLLDISSELEEFESVETLVKHIEKMYGERYGEDTRRILRLCTVHRSKGREWGRVYLLGRNLYMPSRWAKKEWELGQEDNLVYVAWTRTKEELVEVYCKPKKNAEDPDWWEL